MEISKDDSGTDPMLSWLERAGRVQRREPWGRRHRVAQAQSLQHRAESHGGSDHCGVRRRRLGILILAFSWSVPSQERRFHLVSPARWKRFFLSGAASKDGCLGGVFGADKFGIKFCNANGCSTVFSEGGMPFLSTLLLAGGNIQLHKSAPPDTTGPGSFACIGDSGLGP